jgi:hypothetical protein
MNPTLSEKIQKLANDQNFDVGDKVQVYDILAKLRIFYIS